MSVNVKTRREYYLRGMRRATQEIQRLAGLGYRRPREIANIIDAFAAQEFAKSEASGPRDLSQIPDSALVEPIPVRRWEEIRAEVLAADSNRCTECGSTENLHVHHRQQVAHGGFSIHENLVTLCEACHLKLSRPGAGRHCFHPTNGRDLPQRVATSFVSG
jgi:ferredoxin-like protein FixX